MARSKKRDSNRSLISPTVLAEAEKQGPLDVRPVFIGLAQILKLARAVEQNEDREQAVRDLLEVAAVAADRLKVLSADAAIQSIMDRLAKERESWPLCVGPGHHHKAMLKRVRAMPLGEDLSFKLSGQGLRFNDWNLHLRLAESFWRREKGTKVCNANAEEFLDFAIDLFKRFPEFVEGWPAWEQAKKQATTTRKRKTKAKVGKLRGKANELNKRANTEGDDRLATRAACKTHEAEKLRNGDTTQPSENAIWAKFRDLFDRKLRRSLRS